MNSIGITGAAILSLLLGVAAPACAQHRQQDQKQDHPQHRELVVVVLLVLGPI